MTEDDRACLAAVCDAGLVRSPCLELGGGIPEHSTRNFLMGRGLEYRSTDLEGDVTYQVDFEADDVTQRIRERFASVLVMNVLEHVFDPIRVLDNACRLLRPGGTCIVIVPAIWPIHSFPLDCWRVLPDFFRQYAARRGLTLLPEWFRYVGEHDGDMTVLPRPGTSEAHRHYSRVVHRLLSTTGRGALSRSHVAVAGVLEKARATPL